MEKVVYEQQRELQLLPSRHEEVDLQLSIGGGSSGSTAKPDQQRQVEAVRWQAAEQIRMAAMEKAYTERVRELTRREMELAQAELSQARIIWERARDDLAWAERLQLPSSSSMPIQITCHSCRHPFRP